MAAPAPAASVSVVTITTCPSGHIPDRPGSVRPARYKSTSGHGQKHSAQTQARRASGSIESLTLLPGLLPHPIAGLFVTSPYPTKTSCLFISHRYPTLSKRFRLEKKVVKSMAHKSALLLLPTLSPTLDNALRFNLGLLIHSFSRSSYTGCYAHNLF